MEYISTLVFTTVFVFIIQQLCIYVLNAWKAKRAKRNNRRNK